MQKRCFIHTRLHYLTLLNDLPSLQLVLLQCYEKGEVENHMMLILEHSELCNRKLFPEKVWHRSLKHKHKLCVILGKEKNDKSSGTYLVNYYLGNRNGRYANKSATTFPKVTNAPIKSFLQYSYTHKNTQWRGTF